MLYAHSANPQGNRQPLVNHLQNVAGLAAEMAQPFGGEDLAFLAGLWHDVGKADPTWQRLLLECEQGKRNQIGIDHKCAGVLLAERLGGNAQWAGILIHGHHGGLTNPKTGLRSWLQEKRELPGPELAIQKLRAATPELLAQAQPTLPQHVLKDALAAEMFLRMTYSALIDADSLDTEAHQQDGCSHPERHTITDLNELWDRYSNFLKHQPDPQENPVNAVRREVHEACLSAAGEPQGIFRLTVPTGGGKTRSAMAFALRHGVEHRLRRVIVAVPFNTITQQTAGVYREIFEKGYAGHAVLEHHSAADDVRDDDGFRSQEVWQRLASENWDAPIVVTTTVQLFESLFSNRRGRTRKLHNIDGSVIILDEAQALPPHLLSTILDGIRELTSHYGVSVVLSTATQPTFEIIGEFRQTQAREINTNNPRHFQALRRVEYEWRTGQRNPWPEVAGWMRQEPSVLAIVNTKRHALELLDALGDAEALHLSTLLCGAHRSRVLREVIRRLSSGEPCRLVSTQVVEAGVDLDFPAVLRAEAPLDSIIQAAGRCNREGRRERGKVVVFRPPDDASPKGVYGSGRDIARAVRQFPGFDPDNPETVKRYYETLFGMAVDPDPKGIQALRKLLDFPEVAERFRMIQEDTFDVIVPYPEEDAGKIAGLVEQLRAREHPARQILRLLQPHTVSVQRREAQGLAREGWIEEVMPGMGIWHGTYDPVLGITATDPDLII